MYVYRDCSTIPIWNFNEITLKGDLRWMLVGWDGYEDVKVPKEANEHWQNIRNEWVELLDNNAITLYYQLVLEVAYLSFRYDTAANLLQQIATRFMNEETLEKYITALGYIRYKWNKKNSKDVEIKRLLQQHKASQNTINLKLDELEQIKKENDFKDTPANLEKQAVILQNITGIKVNLRKDSVKRWIEIGKLANDINEQRRKNGGK